MEGPLFEGIVAMRHGDTIRGEQLLAKIQSDNTIDGIDYLLRAYEKTAKIAVETAIVPNMTPKTVEGVGEEHSNGLDKGRQPIVGVTQESSLAP
jgi:hypothetical protein